MNSYSFVQHFPIRSRAHRLVMTSDWKSTQVNLSYLKAVTFWAFCCKASDLKMLFGLSRGRVESFHRNSTQPLVLGFGFTV